MTSRGPWVSRTRSGFATTRSTRSFCRNGLIAEGGGRRAAAALGHLVPRFDFEPMVVRSPTELESAAFGGGRLLHWVSRIRLVLALLVVGAAGVAAAFASTAPSSSSARAAVATTVTVKGSDTGARVSPTRFARGTVTFKITN